MDIQQEEEKSIKNEPFSSNFQKFQKIQMEEEFYANQIDLNSDRQSYIKKQKREFQDSSPGKIVDLNLETFEGIVQLCRIEGIITEEMAHSFFNNYRPSVSQEFIHLFRKDNLGSFDFSKCKINIIDHRRLVQKLLQYRPNKYIPLNQPEEPYDFNPQVRNFLKEIYAILPLGYQALLQRQATQFYQYWWGGPKYISPVVDPPVRFSETEQGRKRRIDKQNTIRIQSAQEQKERLRRIGDHRATTTDLLDIAKIMANKIYGQRPPQNLPKLEADNISVNSNASLESSSSRPNKKKKVKKQKSQKSQKQSKKEKKIKKEKSTKKKKKKEKEAKRQQTSEPKVEAENEDNISVKKNQKKKIK